MTYKPVPLIAAALLAGCTTRQPQAAAHGDAVEAAVQYAEQELAYAKVAYLERRDGSSAAVTSEPRRRAARRS